MYGAKFSAFGNCFGSVYVLCVSGSIWLWRWRVTALRLWEGSVWVLRDFGVLMSLVLLIVCRWPLCLLEVLECWLRQGI